MSSDGYATLAELALEHRRLTPTAFRERYRDPVLLDRGQELERSGYKTDISLPDSDPREVSVGLGTQPRLIVIPIRKRPGGQFPERIGIGRTRTVDVSLPHPGVSKYHAYFTMEGDKTYLTDARSKNGTRVDGVALEPGEPVELRDRALLAFGNHHLRFHTPDGLYAVLGVLVFGP